MREWAAGIVGLLRVHVRTIVPVGATVLAGLVASGVLLVGYAKLIGPAAFGQLAGLETSPVSATTNLVLLSVPILLGVIVLGLAWAGVVAQVASGAALRRRVSIGGSVARSFSRLPRAAVVALVAVLAVAVAVALTPLFVVAGILGLIATPFARRWARWPRLSQLVLLAVPFGFAAWMLVRTSLALPSVWLSGSGIRAAFVDSAARSRGREVAIGLVILLSGALTVGVTDGAAALVGGLGDTVVLLTRLAALILVGPLLLVGLVVQYHGAGEAKERPPIAAPPKPRRRARIAAATLFAMVFPLVLMGAPAPAQAAGTTAVSFAIQTSPVSPLPTGSSTTISFNVRDPSSETQQPTGSLRIFIDDVEQTGPFVLPGGFASLDYAYTFPRGAHVIRAEYSGDDNYQAATQTLAVTAVPVDPTVTTTSFTVTPDSPSAAGAPLTAHVLVTAADGSYPTGSVRILLDGTGSFLADQRLETSAHGAIDLVFSLPPGALQRVVAYFEPDAGYQTSHIDLSHTVSPDTSTVLLDADAATTVFGQDVALTAHVTSGTATTGTVDFQARPVPSGSTIDLGSSALASGVATLSTAALPVGSYSLVAVYSGFASVTGAESAGLVHTVGKAAVSVGVVSSIPAPSYLASTQLTATVTAAAPGAGSPTGSIVVKRDGATVGSGPLVGGSASVTVAVGDAGNRDFTVEYSGDDSFQAGTGSLALTVAKLPTTTILTGSSNRSQVYGDLQTYAGTVTASGGTPTGTVELWVGGFHVADGTLSGGAYSISTRLVPVTPDHPTTAWIVYDGDANYESSQVLPVDRPSLEMSKADSVPILTASPSAVAIGSTVTLTATLDVLGAGPTGKVTFSTLAGPIAQVNVVGGLATYDYVVTDATTRFTASYAGDSNFTAQTSDALTINAPRAPTTVTLTGPSTYAYGALVDLVATVAVSGGATPDHGVEFRSTAAGVLASDVPVIAGVATLQVCVGSAAVCPAGIPQLGSGDTSLTARYVDGPHNLEGLSAPVAYTVTKAATSLVLDVTPTIIPSGSAVFLTATVSGPRAGVTPTGTVAFYASGPVDDGGVALSYFIGSGTVNASGVATYETQSGDGEFDLRYPADGVVATYAPAGALFVGSTSNTVPIELQRVATQVTVTAAASTAHAGTRITASLTHDPGASADYTGKVVITSDDAQTCTVTLTGGARSAFCDFTWTSVGDHTVSAKYLGDVIYAPSDSPDAPVSVGKGTPSLGALAPTTAIVGQNVAVHWTVFDPAAGGTVTVWGDGIEWCVVPLAAATCTGAFALSSVTGSPVQIVVRYSGDSNWNGVQQELNVTVSNCAVLDVRSNLLSLGTVTVDTPPNCGGTGYNVGTTVQVTAHPLAGGEFVNWLGYAGGDLEPVSTNLTNTFTVGTGSESWVRVATFRVPCLPITPNAVGSGGISVFPLSNCTTPSGAAGWSYGTPVTISPEPSIDPAYGEVGVIWRIGPIAGGSQDPLTRGLGDISITVTAPIVVPLIFGPRCHVVTVLVDPTTGTDTGTLNPSSNCSSPQGSGLLRGSTVQVTAKLGADRGIVGWSVDGTPLPQFDGKPQASVLIGASDPVVTIHTVGCYTLDLRIDGANDPLGKPVGQVDRDVLPNCPDGSQRYLAGTAVTLTPNVLISGTIFNGWDDNRINGPAPAGTGPVPVGKRTIVMTSNVSTAAGFFNGAYCSPLVIVGDPSSISIENTGCGPGYYFDQQKIEAIRGGEAPSSYWQDRFRTQLRVTVDPSEKLGVYLSIRGDTRHCFGATGDPAGANPAAADWKSYGPITTGDCGVGGPIAIRVQTCQTLVTQPLILANSQLYSDWNLPGTMYFPDENGGIAAYSMSDFDWVTPLGVTVNGDGSAGYEGFGDGACGAARNAFPSDQDLALIASSPGNGFEFIGWKEPDDSVTLTNPYMTSSSSTESTMLATPIFQVSCNTVTFGTGITIDGDVARCPGTSPEQNLYVTGTAIPVRAEARLADGRWFEKFTSGVNATTMFQDAATGDAIGYAYVDQDLNVSALYPTSGEKITIGLIQVGKIMVTILAVAAPIVLSMMFPPAGILFTILGAASGIATLAGSDATAAVFDLINPTKIVQCAAQWGVGNAGDPTGGKNIGKIVSTANKVKQVVQGKDILTPKLTNIGALTGSASFVIGLYNSGITHAELKPQTVEELRDTQTMTGCLNEQWRAADPGL